MAINISVNLNGSSENMRVSSGYTLGDLINDESINAAKVEILVNNEEQDEDYEFSDGDSVRTQTKKYNSGQAA